MRAIEAEKGILKLLHPGRHVDTYTEPIIASEVLKRNPRHCVTRPDMFEYPWIMVRSDSVLKLGRVSYIVPNLTIYKLKKQKGYDVQASLEQKKPPRSYVHWQLLELDSPSKSSAGTTPMHKDHCQSDWQQFQASCRWKSPGASFRRQILSVFTV
ncbi:Phototropic-responsive NPH3 family protein [Hibiscus syriacus]|uniref:Phototropic-responsive NPH3 family protein n=1 Tax=Hibiscus syriacus TaxID=106335 RepID=A0A6A2YQS8_HIBSY|nr:Phototropic-responsive NPH3 family protein [Hibiscus syriacus]